MSSWGWCVLRAPLCAYVWSTMLSGGGNLTPAGAVLRNKRRLGLLDAFCEGCGAKGSRRMLLLC